MTAFTMNDDILNTIAGNEKTIAGLKSNASDLNGQAGELKMNSYCNLVAGIAPVAFTKKSNLPTAMSSQIKAELMEFAGLTESMANKMLKNAAGARRILDLHGDNITPEAVAHAFDQHEITSEAKLIKAVAGDDKKSKVQLAVEKVVGRRSTKKDDKGNRVEGDSWLGGFTYEEIAEFQDKMADAMRVRAEMEAAAQEAGDKAQSDNDAVNEMMAQLDGQAA